MLGLKEIKQRIKGVTNIKQITKAMQMVAVNRVRKTEQRMRSSRPYAENISKLLKRLSLAVEDNSRFFQSSGTAKRIRIILITGDKGLCGAYNSNAIQTAVKFIKEEKGKECSLCLLGKKGITFFKNKEYTVDEFYPVPVEKISSKDISNLSEKIITDFEEEKFDELHIIYTKFVTLSKNIATTIKLLPIEKAEYSGEDKSVDYIFEPSSEDILSRLIPKYVLSQIFSTILESLTSESGSRMVAMKAASENAEEIIGDLNKSYNRARQGTITKELLEIISGAEALRQ